jgi:protein-S-isoprenylcysteine O-methyltransferase Ste14
MIEYIILTIALIIIWLLNGICIIHALKHKLPSEFFMHMGIGLFFTVLAVELCLMEKTPWLTFNYLVIKIIGFALYGPSALLIAMTFIALNTKGKATQMTESTNLITSGIFGIVRQPMSLGIALWALALIMVFQSVFSLILGVAVVFCMRISAQAEINLNIKKFGKAYTQYAQQVPIWNVFKRIFKRNIPKK